MNGIITAVVIVGVIGLIAGLGLSIASVVMAVPKDERVSALREALPGANCGACGYSGCDGYAEAVAKGECEIGLCSPGGADAAKAMSSIMGVEAANVEKRAAMVMCSGGENCQVKTEYAGVPTCAAANQLYSGARGCTFGCIGFGDCMAACQFGAISICGGRAVINQVKCEGCGMCVNACPKRIIDLVPVGAHAAVVCKNADKGAVARKLCTSACIGCRLCEKNCPEGAITVTNNVASVDYSKCTNCGICTEKCPQHCIVLGA